MERPLASLRSFGRLNDLRFSTWVMYEGCQDNRDERRKCEHSTGCMRVFPLSACQLEGVGWHGPKDGSCIDRVGKRPKEALRPGERDKRSQRPCEGRAVGAHQQRVRKRRQQRHADDDSEQRPAGIDLLLTRREATLAPGLPARALAGPNTPAGLL